MTRDEAIAIRNRKYSSDPRRIADAAVHDIDEWVELGMLKLDEPESIESRIHEVMIGASVNCGAVWLMHALNTAGLKIVEK